MLTLLRLIVLPGGWFLLLNGWAYEWLDHKLLARLQNRVGPRWFQPLADTLKLMVKEEIVPADAHRVLFWGLPVVAFAGSLTAVVYLPLLGINPLLSHSGDLIVAFYCLSLLTFCTVLAGFNTTDRFALQGASRTLTQLFSYEAPFLLALLSVASAAGSWQLSVILAYADNRWLILTQPIGFMVALLALIGKVEFAPFDAPEAETEIVAGALTEYTGRGLALFRLAKNNVLVVGLTLLAALYLGGIHSPLDYFLKTLLLLGCIVVGQALFARVRMAQLVGAWWQYGILLALAQWGIWLLIGR